MEPIGPVVSCSSSMLRDENILIVVKVLIISLLDGINDSWLKINQESPGNVVVIVCLVEKHVLPIITLQMKNNT